MTPITYRTRHAVRISTNRCQPALIRRLETAVPGGFRTLHRQTGFLDIMTPYDQSACDIINEWSLAAVQRRATVKALDPSPADRVAQAFWAASARTRVVTR